MHLVPRPRRSLSSRAGSVRVCMLATLLLGTISAIAPVAAQATPSFGVERFFAGNCEHEEPCGITSNPGKPEAEAEGYRQAGGYVPFGVTQFVMNSTEPFPGLKVPVGNVSNVRVDVAPGVVTNPNAVTKCKLSEFTSGEIGFAPGFYTHNTCPASSVIGKQIVMVVGEPEGFPEDVELTGTVYNLEEPSGVSSYYGVELELAPLKGQVKELEEAIGFQKVYSHTIIEGSVDWSRDYHDYFVIKNIPASPPLLSSRLVFYGNKETEPPEHEYKFIRNPTSCAQSGPAVTTTLHVESTAHETETKPYESLIGATGCGALLFNPGFSLTPETSVADEPDGITTQTTTPHPASPSEPDTADLKKATVTLPAGMTINPSAAAGLEGCTPEQIGENAENPFNFEIAPLLPISCPAGSKIGTVSLAVPTLPKAP